ncbi:U-box domain-containing protein 21 [Acorus gramineus]|uniref:U-box domain-containing protein n=1 Tax=Acorus gramineus TaxID=55184 RepID=A0AAV9BML8_ACOGR|nr:U-box domain-containing protein 21 [Acorus gramineus]
MLNTRKQGLNLASDIGVSVPASFTCPISLELMKDPVTLSTGITYDRRCIETWLDSGARDIAMCPVTNVSLDPLEPIPNHAIRRMIQDWCVANRSLGIERIPTPRAPLTDAGASDTLRRVSEAVRCGDHARCLVLVKKVKALSRESERDRMRFVARGARASLAEGFAECADEEASEGILSALALMLPLDEAARASLGERATMRRLVRTLTRGDPPARLDAARVIRDVVASDEARAACAGEVEGISEGLVGLISGGPASARATRASLSAAYFVACASKGAAARLARAGAVGAVVEALAECEGGGTCEAALAVLERVADTEEGRRGLREHALAVVVVVKKVLRVSEAATEMAVAVLWKACAGAGGEGRVVVEALEVGAFQKLLVVLQIGCGESTRERASELLKMMNVYRGRLECIESMDFKELRRSF